MSREAGPSSASANPSGPAITVSMPSPLMPERPDTPTTPGIMQSGFEVNQASSRPLLSSMQGRSGRGTARHPGCVLCSLVASAQAAFTSDPTASETSTSSQARFDASTLPPSPRPDSDAGFSSASGGPAAYPQPPGLLSPQPQAAGIAQAPAVGQASIAGRGMRVGGREIVYADDDITVYTAEGKERLREDGGHLIVAINRHMESVNEMGPADITLLSHMIDVSRRLLGKPETPGLIPSIRFVGTVVRDPASPARHLHAHALSGPIDPKAQGSTFYRRNVVFGALNAWDLEDLRAEIREDSSNNRVKSGYEHRVAPIDRVPDAGSAAGLPNALDPSGRYTDSPALRSTPTSSQTSRQPPRGASNAEGLGNGSTSARRVSAESAKTVKPPSVSPSLRQSIDDGFEAVELTQARAKGKGKQTD